MAPRKSTPTGPAEGESEIIAQNPDDSTVVPTPSGKDKEKNGNIGVEDLGLPKTMVQRLAKGVLPANTQIQRDAQTAIWKSATVFVNYLASNANENAQRANKKTIQPNDVLDAIKDLEFDGFLDRLQAELERYNTTQSEKRNTYRKKVRQESKTAAEGGGSASLPANGQASPSAAATSGPASPQGGIPFDLPYAKPVDKGVETFGSGVGKVDDFDSIRVVIPPTVSRGSREEPLAKKARRSDGRGGHVEDEDEEMEDEDEDVEDEDDEPEEDEEEIDEDETRQDNTIAEDDLLEERIDRVDVDEAMDGDDSD